MISSSLLNFESDISKENQEIHKHHEQIPSIQKRFANDVKNLLRVLVELGNPFEGKEDYIMMTLKSKSIFDDSTKSAIYRAEGLGEEQYQTFVTSRLIDGSAKLTDAIKKNKLQLLKEKPKKNSSVTANKLKSSKCNVKLLSQILIGSQGRPATNSLDDVFDHENQSAPPSLSENNQLRTGTKSDIVGCLEYLFKDAIGPSSCTCFIIDGPVLVHLIVPESSKTFGDYYSSMFLVCSKEIVRFQES